MTSNEIVNAKIESCSIGYESHGIMTVWLTLDYGDGSKQGFGGYSLDEYDKTLKKRLPHKALSMFITRCIEVVGVSEWDKLKGKSIRVKLNGKAGLGQSIEAIGNYLKNNWFYPKQELKQLEEK